MNTHISNYMQPQYRPDIDGLRALAVLAVVAYHASPMHMRGGFIGVDIFFVISGFLISTIIFQNLERNSFSFIEFYSRRVKRIFPALLLVLSCCFLFGWIGLYNDEFQQLGKHILGGEGFISNFLLWQESGYFDSAAESKPLLHLWSLGIEEQFYIICPFFLWILHKRRLNPLIPILTLCIASFLLNVIKVQQDAVSTFYSPQTRFWELLVGVILAYYTLNNRHQDQSPWFNNISSTLGIGLLLLGFVFVSNQRMFPGIWALLPTLGAALIIHAGPKTWFNRKLFAHKLMVWFGLISFPLYLWHWPILSFTHIIANGHDASRWVRIVAVLTAILCAWLTYQFLEKPIRHGNKNVLKPLAFASLVVLFGGILVYKNEGYPSRLSPLIKNKLWTARAQVLVGYEKSPIYKQAAAIKERDFHLVNFAKGQHASIAILGDSHANRLYWALASSKKIKLINLGRGTCPALFGVEVYDTTGESLNCQPLTNDYLQYIKEDPQVKMVVLNAFYNQYHREFSLKANNRTISLEAALNNTLNYFKDSSKKVVVTLDIPEIPQTCYQRNLPVWDTPLNAVCTMSSVEFTMQNQSIVDVLNKHKEVAVFNPESVFCNERCGEIDRNNYLYLSDGNHLNDFGLDRLGPVLRDFIVGELA